MKLSANPTSTIIRSLALSGWSASPKVPSARSVRKVLLAILTCAAGVSPVWAQIGPSGGETDHLSFAILGNTRPPVQDDAAGYPTAIIGRIYQDIQNYVPRPDFAIDTGTYMFAGIDHVPGTQGTQIDDYLQARNQFSNILFPALGDHECTGATADNCGTNTNLVSSTNTNWSNYTNNNPKVPYPTTENYVAFKNSLLSPVKQSLPYYTINISSNSHPAQWTAKFVFVACNAWSTAQANWLNSQLAVPTTYTFVVRNEPSDANTAPCLSLAGDLNADAIMHSYPYTLLIAGFTGEYAYSASEKEVVVGNGGAPLTTSADYGYVIATLQPNGNFLFTAYDYLTNKEVGSFTVGPSGPE